MWWCMFIIQCWVWGDRKTLETHWSSSPSLFGELQVNERLCLRGGGQYSTQGCTLASMYLHTYMNMTPHIHEHVQTDAHIERNKLTRKI